MFRLAMHNGSGTSVMKIEGQLSGDYAEYTRTLLARCDTRMKLVVDLTDVTFVDSVGEDALLLCARFGAEFIADTAYARDLCERLKLPLTQPARRRCKHD